MLKYPSSEDFTLDNWQNCGPYWDEVGAGFVRKLTISFTLNYKTLMLAAKTGQNLDD